jgi:hypothetical protein
VYGGWKFQNLVGSTMTTKAEIKGNGDFVANAATFVGNVSTNRSLTLGADIAGGERITFQGVVPGYRTIIENNYDSNRAFAITTNGLDVIKCTSDVYGSLTLGHAGTQDVVFPGVKASFNGNVTVGHTAGARATLDVIGLNDTQYLIGLSNSLNGLRLTASASYAHVEAVDPTLNSAYRPLLLKGSTVRIEGDTTFNGPVTSVFSSSTTGLSTLDLSDGQSRLHKDTTLNEIRNWVNDGGVMKKSAAYT